MLKFWGVFHLRIPGIEKKFWEIHPQGVVKITTKTRSCNGHKIQQVMGWKRTLFRRECPNVHRLEKKNKAHDKILA